MDIIVIIVFVLCAVFIFPVLSGLLEINALKLKAIVEVEDGKITIRKLAVERIFCLKGNTVHSHSIVRIQFYTNPIRGTCVTLFNKSNGALDFWVPEHLGQGVKSELINACPHAQFVEI
ncbi:hypothetical protein [Vibrio diabolicus]|uniref:hypothetical protein n=1 Tax=Vibrio diabolicus TaxID=50719 RepID=UPI00232E9E2D|nr:hypothetical protein [Vibrio diabolicus]